MQRMFGVLLLVALLFVALPGFVAVSHGLDVSSATADNRQPSVDSAATVAPGTGARQVIWSGDNDGAGVPDTQPGSTTGTVRDLELTALWITPSSPRANEPFTIMFDLYNRTYGSIAIAEHGIGLRGPDACAFDNPWTAPMPSQPEGWYNEAIPALTHRRFIRQYPGGKLQPGHYILEPVYHCTDGSCTNPYPAFQTSSPIWFDVRNNDGSVAVPNCLVVEDPLRITPEHPRPGDQVTASFSIRNRTSQSIPLDRLLAAGRAGADWSSGVNADFPDATNAPRSLAPGAVYRYQASRRYDTAGAYIAEPWRKSGSISGGIWGGNRVSRYVADWVCGLNDVPVYFQGYPTTPVSTGYPARVRWANQAMGQPGIYPDVTTLSVNTMGDAGCLVTAHAMVFAYLAQQVRSPWWANPSDLNQWMRAPNNGGYGGAEGLDLVWNNVLKYPFAQSNLMLARTDAVVDDQALKDALCQGRPAIIWLPDAGHWVTVTGVVRVDGRETFAINDPRWGQTTLAESYQYAENYGALKIYQAASSRPERAPLTMIASASQSALQSSQATQLLANSPVQLLVTDPWGRRAGYDPRTGTTWSEIPGATYGSYPIRRPDGTFTARSYELTIAEPLDGDYDVQTIGQAAGDYTVRISTQDPTASTADQVFTGAATAGSQTSYGYAYPPAASAASVYLPAVQVAPSPTPVPTPSPTPDPKAARLRVDPPSGVSGTHFEIYGENFGANEAVDEWVIAPDGTRSDDPTPQQTDGKGRFSSWIEIFNPSGGVYMMVARGQTSGRQASTTFEIVAGQ